MKSIRIGLDLAKTSLKFLLFVSKRSLFYGKRSIAPGSTLISRTHLKRGILCL